MALVTQKGTSQSKLSNNQTDSVFDQRSLTKIAGQIITSNSQNASQVSENKFEVAESKQLPTSNQIQKKKRKNKLKRHGKNSKQDSSKQISFQDKSIDKCMSQSQQNCAKKVNKSQKSANSTSMKTSPSTTNLLIKSQIENTDHKLIDDTVNSGSQRISEVFMQNQKQNICSNNLRQLLEPSSQSTDQSPPVIINSNSINQRQCDYRFGDANFYENITVAKGEFATTRNNNSSSSLIDNQQLNLQPRACASNCFNIEPSPIQRAYETNSTKSCNDDQASIGNNDMFQMSCSSSPTPQIMIEMLNGVDELEQSTTNSTQNYSQTAPYHKRYVKSTPAPHENPQTAQELLANQGQQTYHNNQYSHVSSPPLLAGNIKTPYGLVLVKVTPETDLHQYANLIVSCKNGFPQNVIEPLRESLVQYLQRAVRSVEYQMPMKQKVEQQQKFQQEFQPMTQFSLLNYEKSKPFYPNNRISAVAET